MRASTGRQSSLWLKRWLGLSFKFLCFKVFELSFVASNLLEHGRIYFFIFKGNGLAVLVEPHKFFDVIR